MNDFKYHNHLGFRNPYFFEKENEIYIDHNLYDLSNKRNEDNYIDFTSVVQILNRNYIFGDRTLIEGINKSPWMAKLEENNKGWNYYCVPDHAEKESDQEYISQHLFDLLKEELLEYLKGKSNIGILLTGGMDSRITACVLNDLIKKDEIEHDIKILGITWGDEDSRDVVYASRIAKILSWDWLHLKVTAEELIKNIEVAAVNGCEFSPIHLHAMPQISKLENLDCIIASSFGDSIGRGEYSGKRVTNLRSYTTKSRFSDIAGILRADFLDLTYNEIKSDVDRYHKLFPQKKEYQQLEQDYQLHYMRRMLNPCMAIIDQNIPLFQMFSAPKVFGFMWSLHPETRNDAIYKIILETKNKKLLEIPWARTGLIYPDKNGTPDNYSKKHTRYGKLIRNEVLPVIKDKVLSNNISKLNLFDMTALQKLIKRCQKAPIESFYYYEERLIWIAALSDFISIYNIKTNYTDFYSKLGSNLLGYGKYYKRYFKQIIINRYL